MGTLPRGNCPECGNEVALRKGDLVREHPARQISYLRNPKLPPRSVCPGAGRKATQVMDRGGA